MVGLTWLIIVRITASLYINMLVLNDYRSRTIWIAASWNTISMEIEICTIH